MLSSDLGSFPKGTIKMPRRFFIPIFGGIESAFRSSCKFSKKNFRYLSFACPKLRQIALLLSTLPLVLKPAQCCPAQSMSRSDRRHWSQTQDNGMAHPKTGCCPKTYGQQAVLCSSLTDIKTPRFSTRCLCWPHCLPLLLLSISSHLILTWI